MSVVSLCNEMRFDERVGIIIFLPDHIHQGQIGPPDDVGLVSLMNPALFNRTLARHFAPYKA